MQKTFSKIHFVCVCANYQKLVRIILKADNVKFLSRNTTRQEIIERNTQTTEGKGSPAKDNIPSKLVL